MKEQKTAKHILIILSNNLRKRILDYTTEMFPTYLSAHGFNHYLFPSQKGSSQWIGLKNIESHSMRKTLRYIGITQEDKDTAVMSLDL